MPGRGAETITVKRLDHRDYERWDRFVQDQPTASFFHRAGWRDVAERAFGHQTHYLYAESLGNITGILPLARIRSFLFGDALVSTPFCVYGGIVASDQSARDVLERQACQLAERLGVDYLEMRNRQPVHTEWPTKTLYWAFRKQIDPDPDVNLNAIPRKQRAMVRKGIDAGLEAEVDTGIDRFYSVYSESVRNLGTPVFSRKYFQVLNEIFGDDCEVLTVTTADGKSVAGVMSFYFRDEVLPYYGGSTADARNLKANDFMYWDLMRRAAGKGVRVFDYGRSKKDTGSYRFKKHWGFEPEQMYYEYYLVRARTVPDVSPNNPRYKAFISVWRHLPLFVTRLAGPFLARNLG